MNRARRHRPVSGAYTDPFEPRSAQPGVRWYVGRTTTGQWFTGPRPLGMYADFATRRRWIYFATWAEAVAYALERSHR